MNNCSLQKVFLPVLRKEIKKAPKGIQKSPLGLHPGSLKKFSLITYSRRLRVKC
jgi:hypothetical protein